LCYPAVFAAAWIAGLRGGLAAGVLSAVCARHFFLEPADSFFVAQTADRIAEAIFFASCVMVAYMSEQRRRAITRAAAREAERTDLLLHAESARVSAEEANRLKDEFLMTLSHELRTPLNAIWEWARMLRGGYVEDARRDRAVDVIERTARVQFQLIEDLLDVSRASPGHCACPCSVSTPRTRRLCCIVSRSAGRRLTGRISCLESRDARHSFRRAAGSAEQWPPAPRHSARRADAVRRERSRSGSARILHPAAR
jgi:K+-sensing histidine kinase KdpD